MNLGENIYKYRTGKNLSQGDLADALDVSRQSVSKWENNSATPELDKLMKMAELFGITLDELVTGTEREKTEAAEPAPVQGELPRVINENHPESAFLSIPLFIIGILLFVFLPGHFVSWLVGAPLILSGLFVLYIGIDAYLREKGQRPAPEKQPDLAVPEGFSGRKIAGAICLGLGLLFAVVCVLLMILTGNRYEEALWVAVILIGVPLVVIGVSCLCLQYPQLFCGWIAWAGYLVYTFMLTLRWEEETFLMIVAALGLIVMLVWTVWAQRSGKARLPKWLLIVGCIVIALLVILFVINAFPPLFESVDELPAIPMG